MALKDFYEGFPEFAPNKFYVTGESYAGVYVPMLSELVMEDPDFNFQVTCYLWALRQSRNSLLQTRRDSVGTIEDFTTPGTHPFLFQIQGFAVGNPFTDLAIMGNGIIYFSWARGFFSSQ